MFRSGKMKCAMAGLAHRVTMLSPLLSHGSWRASSLGPVLVILCEALDVNLQSSGEAIELTAGVLGVVTDVHANPYALEAVLNHGARLGIERWLVLGDVVAMGPEPRRVLDQLAGVDVVSFIAGNTERYVLTGDRPDPTFAEVAASFAWTKGYLQASGALEQLRTYRPSVRFRFPDHTRCLAVHASLVADDGRGISPELDADGFAVLFPEVDADIVFGGHTHVATDRVYGGTRYVNPGSISNHDAPHLDACYTIVRIGENDHRIEHHSVEYDKQLAVDSIRRSGIPGSGFLLGRYFNTVEHQ